jgi:Integrase
MNGKSKLNRHLYLRNGVWWTRIDRGGLSERSSTGCPKSEVVAARTIRNKRLAEVAERREGVERPGRVLTLGELLAAYLADESGFYDREKGGEQPGTKRSAGSDRGVVKRIKSHLSPSLSSSVVNREILLDLARKIEREVPMPAPGTRRKSFAFVRRAFSWATEHPRRTGITVSPFASLTRADRAKLFPRPAKRGYLYSPDELQGIYENLPLHLRPFVRFAVYTGMRFSEITSLAWGAVNVERKALTVEARFAKNKREREVALGEVALRILADARPAVDPGPSDHVFLGRRGGPILDVRGGFNAAVLKVWKPSRPGEMRPRFHDLRKTGATRLEAVSSHAVAKAFLGHADGDVTDTYILPSLDAVRDAINRAARSIDGEIPAGVLAFPQGAAQNGTPDVTAPAAAGQ